MTTDPQPIIDAAVSSTEPHVLATGEVYAIRSKDSLAIVDLTTDRYRDEPRRKQGHVSVHDGHSLVEYVKKHGTFATEVYCDMLNYQIVAVLNAGYEAVAEDDAVGEAGWGDHRVSFAVARTPAWKEWSGNDGKTMAQVDFAEFIEDHLTDITSPAAADMLEVAQSIQATINTVFESSKRLSSGEAQFEYREEQTASAGKGRLDIPTTIELALKPFEGSPPYKVEAHFRYRINAGRLSMSYKLVKPDDVIRDAFDGVVADVTEALGETGATVFVGIPAEPRVAEPLSPALAHTPF
jgi:uncharacterized protein YfdQ (DUF2303 family)